MALSAKESNRNRPRFADTDCELLPATRRAQLHRVAVGQPDGRRSSLAAGVMHGGAQPQPAGRGAADRQSAPPPRAPAGGGSPDMGTATTVPGIRGRAAEIAALGEALDRVASGRLAVVLIEGEAGIGKTRLLDEGLADARGRGMQVAAGRAQELTRAARSAWWPRRSGARHRRRIRGGQPSEGCWRPTTPTTAVRSR